MLPRSKAPKRSKFSVTDIRDKPVNYFCGAKRASTIAPKIILPTEVPLKKVSIPVETIIYCAHVLRKWSCLLLQLYTNKRTQLPPSMHCTGAYTVRLIADSHNDCNLPAAMY